MKVALMFSAPDVPGVYGEDLFTDPQANAYFYHLIDSAALLPVGTEIHFEDPDSDEGIDLIVTKLHFSLADNLLSLQVTVDEGSEITPENFKRYIETNWMNWVAIKNLVKVS